MDLLVELCWTFSAVEGFVTIVEAHVGLEVAGAAEALITDMAAMRLLSCMD